MFAKIKLYLKILKKNSIFFQRRIIFILNKIEKDAMPFFSVHQIDNQCFFLNIHLY